MADAPRPGAGKRKKAAEEASKVLELTLRGETYLLGLGTITIDDRTAVRKGLGLPVEAYLNQDAFGLDSLFVVWWLSGRQQRPSFSFDEAKAQFPWDMTEDEVSFKLVDAADSPEA